MKSTKSKVTVYVHRTNRMRDMDKNRFRKGDRPRIEVKLPDKDAKFIYADEFMKYIVDEFRYRGL